MREVKAPWSACVLVCTHEREPETGRASCGLARGTELRTWLKARAKDAGLKGRILTAKSGCLDVCSPLGVTVAAIPPSGSDRPRRMWIAADDTDREQLFGAVRDALLGTEESDD